MRTVSDLERRTRLARRHHLARPVAHVDTVAADLLGLHSSDPASVYLAARARVRRFMPSDLERSLYEERSLVRMLGMRRTMFVVTREGAALMDAACTQALASGERRRFAGILEEQAIAPDGAAWITRAARATLAELAARGEATAAELSRSLPELRQKLHVGAGKKWEGTVGVSTRLLFLLAAEGRIVRGRPLGSWISSQYRWALTTSWLDGALATIAPSIARAELARCYLWAYGPATLVDLAWWTGWTQRTAKAAIGALDTTVVALDDGSNAMLLTDDLAPVRRPAPWVAFLPALDPTVMGWKSRGWYLGDHQEALFDTNGNAGPTIWADGHIVCGWAQVGNEIAIRLLEPVAVETRQMIKREAARLRSWLGDLRFTPRFRTPLERELSAVQP